jgi:hypothetical protein
LSNYELAQGSEDPAWDSVVSCKEFEDHSLVDVVRAVEEDSLHLRVIWVSLNSVIGFDWSQVASFEVAEREQ